MEDRILNLQKNGITSPYASQTHRNATIKEVVDTAFSGEGKEFIITGRISSVRKHGSLLFYDIEDQESKIQVICKKDLLGESEYAKVKDSFVKNDIIEVRGHAMMSKSNEPSILIQSISMVAPCLEILNNPKDVTKRFSNRTADIIQNKDTKKRLILRSKILFQTRAILEKHGFLETTTPILQGKYGGGKSAPFTSHCNALKQDMFLRATMDLYLKRIVAGGIERVYEIDKAFRNEAISSMYNPEFTLLEAYGAYMQSSEMSSIIQEVVNNGLKEVNKVFPDIWNNVFSWKRVNYKDACKDILGIDVSNSKDYQGIMAQCKQRRYDVSACDNLSDLHNKIAETILGHHFIAPTILNGLPTETSPLMHRKEDNPDELDREWFFVNGIMFCDLAKELSEPTEQIERLKEQKLDLKHEYDNIDQRHIQALRLGCPFISGVGFGFDRFLQGITKTPHIRENIPYPIAYEVYNIPTENSSVARNENINISQVINQKINNR